MSLVKEEYQSLLALLGRVETKGVAEAQALVALAQKLDSRIKTWFDGHVTGFKQDVAVVTVDADKVAELVDKAV
jgi:hypothetical protein